MSAEQQIAAHLLDLSSDSATQNPAFARGSLGIRRTRSLLRVQVGLDFGTSTTKVMYQQLGTAQRVVRPLKFGHDIEGCPDFALPSLATFDTSGNLLLGDVAARVLAADAGATGLSRFKMLLAGCHEPDYLDREQFDRYNEHVKVAIGDENLCPPEWLATTYLAFAMRRARRHIAQELRTTELDLAFNVCVPVDQRENSAVLAAFQSTVAAAQHLERNLPRSVSMREWLDHAGALWNEIRYDENDPDNRVFLVPEALAGSAAYITSLGSESGIHALVDIGAGTTDVCVFDLKRARVGGTTTYWYAARSIPMGAAWVEDVVREELSKHLPLEQLSAHAIQQAMSGSGPYASACKAAVHDELTRIWNGTGKVWADAYKHFATQSYWQGRSVRVFVAGGGALIPAALSVFSRSWVSRWGPYPCSILPTPESFVRGGSGAPFVRLSVAFGLTTPIPELGNYVLPSEAPNGTPPKSVYISPYRIGEDQLIPKYGWT